MILMKKNKKCGKHLVEKQMSEKYYFLYIKQVNLHKLTILNRNKKNLTQIINQKVIFIIIL